jgi:hypothetical protein
MSMTGIARPDAFVFAGRMALSVFYCQHIRVFRHSNLSDDRVCLHFGYAGSHDVAVHGWRSA